MKTHTVRALVLFVLILIPLALFAAVSHVAAQSSGTTGTAIDTWMTEQKADGSLSAASAVWISSDGIRTATLGADASTRFQIGSVTKPFTNLLLAEMVAAGDVDYDTRVRDVLGPDFRAENEAILDITLLELATHTSGLPRLPANLHPAGDDPYANYGVDDLLEGLKTARAHQPLGDFYSYSNFGAGLLGHLLGRVDGRGYSEALAERVLKPLGLADTGLEPGKDAARAVSRGHKVPAWTFRDSMAGAGALWSTADDLARVMRAYMDTPPSGLRHVIAGDLTVVKAARDVSLTRVWHSYLTESGPIYWHNGRTAGHGAFLGFRPGGSEEDAGVAVALLVAGDADPTAIGLELLGYTPASSAGPSDRAVDSPEGSYDQRIFGQYRLTPDFGLGVFVSDGVLKTQATGQPAFELHPVGDDWYALGEVDASLLFVIEAGEEGGKIVAAELAQGGRVQRAAKVSDVADAARRTEVSVSRTDLEEYVGTYALASGAAFTVRLADDGLEARLTGQPFLPIFPKGDDIFFYKVVDAELHFERSNEGNVSALVLHQGGMEQRALRTRNSGGSGA